MSYSDDIRKHCAQRYVEPARARRVREVRIRAGDVHRDRGYRSRIPLVCSALGANAFGEMCRVGRKEILGPLNGSNTVFVFEILL